MEPEHSPEAYETKTRTDIEKIYQEAISAAADKAVTEQQAIIDKEDLVKRSVENYSKTYKAIMVEFFDKTG